MKSLTHAAVFSDIHFGGRSNSDQHNLDCSTFVDWFCSIVRKHPEIDHILFLGDWFENRSSINVATLRFSHFAAKMLNALGLPIFFMVGNHDIYHRHTREIHSSLAFDEFENFHIIDHPTVIDRIGNGGALLTPYLFPQEYKDLIKFNHLKTWWGHFEFRGFVITGSDIRMPTGPSISDFNGPDYIFSGHFHKRQAHENLVYVGNTFPTNFNDAGDFDRGMMLFNHDTMEVQFIDWEECPKFIKTKLSALIDDPSILLPNARVRCEIDIPIDYQESSYIKTRFTKKYGLREMILDESPTIHESLSDTESKVDDELNKKSLDDTVIEMISGIDNENISNDLLIQIYRDLIID